ncbi:hypothetical protein D9C73_017430 [Collichthys lucidus]|uniref:Uncharacterized protein n=1 Tax=Collichthys lucidus TaxID=240159 RepID=A0A4U5V6R7_COLLU|nr:hypothetical protein D9C73_017430 [Collichthys lucidus]
MLLYEGCPVPLPPVDKQKSDSESLGLSSEPGKLKEPVSTSAPIMAMDRVWFSFYPSNGTNPGSTFWGKNQHAGTTDPNLHQEPASHRAQCAFQASVARNNIALLAYLLTELKPDALSPEHAEEISIGIK